MKTTVLSLVMLGLTLQAFSQEVLADAKIKKEEVPKLVLDAVQSDFPAYIMKDVHAVPLQFMEEDKIITKAMSSGTDYESFEIRLIGKGKDLSATYDKMGKLISSTEHLKNVSPPAEVRNSLAKAYPGWTIVKDSYSKVDYANGKQMNHFRIILENKGKKMKVYTNGEGNILNPTKM